MSNQSIIEHKANMHYVEFREDYLIICLACTYKKPVKSKAKSKASPYCKALILSISESWTNDKRSRGADLSFYMTYPQWIESMYGMFGRNVVIDSLDELIGEGLLHRDPVKYKGKDTFRYTLNHTELNQRMKKLDDRPPYNTHPQVDAFTSKPVGFPSRLQVNGMAFTNKPDTRLQVNEDAFTKGRNIESTHHPYVDSAQNTEGTCSVQSATVTSGADAPTRTLENTAYRPDPSSESATAQETIERINDVLPQVEDELELRRASGALPAQAELSTAGASSAQSRGKVEPSNPKKPPKKHTRTPRVPKVDPAELDLYRRVFDDCRREALCDESEGYPHTAASDKCIEGLLALNVSRPKFVTPKKLHAVYVRLWNMPREERSGFYWREHMSIKAICNNYEEQALAMTAAAKEKQRQQALSEEEAKQRAREQAQSGELVGGMYRRYVPPTNAPLHYITAEQRAALGGK